MILPIGIQITKSRNRNLVPLCKEETWKVKFLIQFLLLHPTIQLAIDRHMLCFSFFRFYVVCAYLISLTPAYDAGCVHFGFSFVHCSRFKTAVQLNCIILHIANYPSNRSFSYFQKIIQFATDNLFSNLAHGWALHLFQDNCNYSHTRNLSSLVCFRAPFSIDDFTDIERRSVKYKKD